MRGKIKDKVYIKLEDGAQKLKLFGGSWSINLDELSNKKIDTVIYKTQTEEYSIPFSQAVNIGSKMNFKGENKLVVPIRYWTKKSNRVKQELLFK